MENHKTAFTPPHHYGTHSRSAVSNGTFEHLQKFLSRRHPHSPVVARRTGDENPLVGGLDLYHQPPLVTEDVGLGVIGGSGAHCQEVEDGVAAVEDGAADGEPNSVRITMPPAMFWP